MVYLPTESPKDGLVLLNLTTTSNTTLTNRAGTSCALLDAGKRRMGCWGGEVNDTTMQPSPLLVLEVDSANSKGQWTEFKTNGASRDSAMSAVYFAGNSTSSLQGGLVTFGGRYQAINKTSDVVDAELRWLPLSTLSSPQPNLTTSILINSTLNTTYGPGPRIFHCVVPLPDDRIFIGFGSSPTGQSLDDTWIYFAHNNSWANIDPWASGVKPPAMSGPACSWDGKRNRILVFGPGTSDRNQVSQLLVSDLTWSILEVSIPNPVALEPSLRWGANADVVGDWMVVWGGYLVNAGVWTYDGECECGGRTTWHGMAS